MEEAHGPAGKKVLDRIPVRYDESFIDLGTGNGWAARYIAARVPTIGLCVGVDASEEFVKEARRAAGGRYPVKYIHSTIEDVPFPEASFDHAFSMEAFYYAKDPLVALKSVWRVLRTGGVFHMVIDFYRENPPSQRWQEDIATKMQFLSQDEWVDLFGKAGFQDVVAERVLDERPVPEDMAFPWGGFRSREELVKFRTRDGSLYVRGTKRELSHALDPYLDRAGALIRQEEGAGTPVKAKSAPRGRARR
jgi:SAM-dependent methyltransferase